MYLIQLARVHNRAISNFKDQSKERFKDVPVRVCRHVNMLMRTHTHTPLHCTKSIFPLCSPILTLSCLFTSQEDEDGSWTC